LIGKGVARRYATALFKVGIEDGQVEKYGEEIKIFADFLESDQEIKLYLVTPLYEKTQRQQVLETLLEKLNLSEVVRRFIMLLFEKKRLCVQGPAGRAPAGPFPYQRPALFAEHPTQLGGFSIATFCHR
jgi:F0F1-type ATP synthase delta subunit